MVPLWNTTQDKNAAGRALDFMFGWFMEPITKGYYPKTTESLVGKRLPKFFEEEAKMIKGSIDFLGLNYYTANYAASASKLNNGKPSYLADSLANLTTKRKGIPIGPKVGD
ncbi:hypothetical protein SLE2022_356700 [Rubroshorea leprosula]